MTNNDNITERLRFLGIDDDVRATLREAKPYIYDALPEILSGFYDHIREYPEVARMFSDTVMMDRAKQIQVRHWGLILSAEFDDTYVASVKKIGHVHNRIGLEPRWYIGGYNYISCKIMEAVSNKMKDSSFGSKSAKRSNWLTALNRAVMLDMDIAISVYLEEGKRERKELLDRLAANFEASVSGVISEVATSATDMRKNAESLTQIAHDAKARAQVVSTAATQASQASAGVASASEELSSAIGEISNQIQKSTEVTKRANNMALNASGAMKELLEQTKSISQVSDFINAVAGQINLLALNATIESARAGEAGKGFAVVASEVKALAGQTTKASEDIGLQVKRIQDASSLTEQQIIQIVGIIEEIDANTSSIAAAVEEQSTATNEIARNVSGTSQASQDVTRNIAVVENGAEQTNISSTKVLNTAEKLNEQTTLLRDKVHEFLNTVKAA